MQEVIDTLNQLREYLPRFIGKPEETTIRGGIALAEKLLKEYQENSIWKN